MYGWSKGVKWHTSAWTSKNFGWQEERAQWGSQQALHGYSNCVAMCFMSPFICFTKLYTNVRAASHWVKWANFGVIVESPYIPGIYSHKNLTITSIISVNYWKDFTWSHLIACMEVWFSLLHPLLLVEQTNLYVQQKHAPSYKCECLTVPNQCLLWGFGLYGNY